MRIPRAWTRLPWGLESGTVLGMDDLVALPVAADARLACEWLSCPPGKASFRCAMEPLDRFAEQAALRWETLASWPRDLARTNRILKLLETGDDLWPVFAEEGDPAAFVMEGRHRIIAAWRLGIDPMPVIWVRTSTDPRA